jgi:hypothetical protein
MTYMKLSKQQDRLENGLLKTEEGKYIDIVDLGVYIGERVEWLNGRDVLISDKPRYTRFDSMANQDKLAEGMLRVSNGTYVSLANELSVNFPEETEGRSPTFCYIATAVYGDINHPQVEALRQIRDRKVMKNAFGKVFVDFYYSRAGKAVADFIKKHAPFVAPTVRKGLDCIIKNTKLEANLK